MINAEFDSKISYIMFLHDYHLASEISTVRTLALSLSLKILEVDIWDFEGNRFSNFFCNYYLSV